MTTRELIEHLSTFPPDTPVYAIRHYEDGFDISDPNIRIEPVVMVHGTRNGTDASWPDLALSRSDKSKDAIVIDT